MSLSEIVTVLSKTEVWVPIVIGLAPQWVKPIWWAGVKIKSHLPKFKSKTAKTLKKFARRGTRSGLLKVKAKRFNQTAINREIAKNYTYLSLFWIFTSTWYLLTLLQIIDKPMTVLGAVPIIYFEIMWLTKSFYVDNLVIHAKKIKQNARLQDKRIRYRESIESIIFHAGAAEHDQFSKDAIRVIFSDESLSKGTWVASYGTTNLCMEFDYALDPEKNRKIVKFYNTRRHDKDYLLPREADSFSYP